VGKLAQTLLIALAVGLAGCDSGLSGASLSTDPDGSKTVLITSSPGGNLDAYDHAFRNWSRVPGVKVEIRRWCASACTQVLGYFTPEQICLAQGARVGFHSATALRAFAVDMRTPPPLSQIDSISTLLMLAAYPSWIQDRLSRAGVMGARVGNPSTSLSADEFWNHGYRVCPDTALTAAASRSADKRGG
jgi:hypothetical protein